MVVIKGQGVEFCKSGTHHLAHSNLLLECQKCIFIGVQGLLVGYWSDALQQGDKQHCFEEHDS